MKRAAFIITSTILLLSFLAACKKETSPQAPLESEPYFVQIEGRASAISAREGQIQALAFDVRTIYEDHSIAVSKPVALKIIAGPGEIAPSVGLTDREGILKALFFVALPYGDSTATIRAVGETDSAEFAIGLHGAPTPANIQLTANPAILQTHYTERRSAELRALVTDRRGRPMPNIQVGFNVLVGAVGLGPVIAQTDAQGIASNQLTANGIWFGDAVIAAVGLQHFEAPLAGGSGTPAERTVVAGADQTPLIDTLVVPVRQIGSVNLAFFFHDTTLYTNSEIDRIFIRARLSDSDNNSIGGRTIEFSAPGSLLTVTPAAITDPFGVAVAELGLTGAAGRGVVRARYNALGLEDSLSVTVMAMNVRRVELDLENRFPTRWVDSSYQATVRVFGPGDEPLFHILTQLASNLTGATTIVLTDVNGIARHTYIPTYGGNENLRAAAVNFNVVSPPLSFFVYKLPMQISGSLMPIQEGYYVYRYGFGILDARNIGVPDERVRFSITLGGLNHNEVITDAQGRGEVKIARPYGFGVAEFVIEWRQNTGRTTIEFPQPQIRNMSISGLPSVLSARGTGAVDTSAVITAALIDEYGDTARYAPPPHPLYFSLIREPPPPEGCSINGRSADSLLFVNGVGQATFYSGSLLGGKLVRAYTFRDDARRDTLSVTLSAIAVVAGPPAMLDIDYTSDGDDAGGGAWVIVVSTRVMDRLRNPVRDGIPVVWTVEPRNANIMPGLTGNVVRNYGPTPGTAYGELFYQSVYSGDTITLTATVESPLGRAVSSRELVLPLQDGELQLNVDPQNYMFDRNNPNEVATIRIWATLRDGHQIPINNMPVLFTASRGRLYWYNQLTRQYIDFGNEPARRWTGRVDGISNEAAGTATVFLRGTYDEIFPDMPLEVNIQINARVEGYDVQADPAFIFMTRR